MRRKRLARRADCHYLWGLNAGYLGDGSGKTEFAEGGNAPPVVASNEIVHRDGAGGPAERVILGSRDTGGGTSPKRRESNQKLSAAMNCQGVQPKSFVPGEAGLR